MTKKIARELEARGKPINVAIAGAGWFGSGLAKELFRIPGMEPRALIDRNIDRAVEAYLRIGVDGRDIAVVNEVREMGLAQDAGKYLVFSSFDFIKELRNADLVYEATGDLLGGAQAAVCAFEAGIDFVTVNAEMEATIGLRLANLAKERGIIYSNSDGDQPGVLAGMLDEILFFGFEPRVVGNCKNFLNQYQTPAGVQSVIPKGIDAVKACCYADGSKQSAELATLGNAYGYWPLKQGMYGPITSKQDLISTFDRLVDLDSLDRGHIDFTTGTNLPDQGAAVFIVAYSSDPMVRANMKWVQMGNGPCYLFFRDHHLGAIEAPSTIAEVTLFRQPTLVPEGRYVEVIAVAKRDISPGQELDGIGGYDCYGIVERADTAEKDNRLPIGLAEFATATREIPKDTLITYEMVALRENLVVRLRREQDRLPLPQVF
jgi:predicted homoserine dehydrogenase-like protein